MTRTDDIQSAHGLSLDEAVKILMFNHQGAQWIKGVDSYHLQDAMDKYTERIANLPTSTVRKFIEYIKTDYWAQPEEEVSRASFEARWLKGEKILRESKP
jgi:hypothetical protein